MNWLLFVWVLEKVWNIENRSDESEHIFEHEPKDGLNDNIAIHIFIEIFDFHHNWQMKCQLF